MNRLARGESMAELCREFGISRKTGHKFKARLDRLGEAGLEDQSRAPHVIPHRTQPELVELVLAARRQHPTWGARKIKAVLERQLERTLPAPSTISAALSKAGLVTPRRRRSAYASTGTYLRDTTASNDLWCIDYKGQFRLGDRTYCYPLTLTDHFSRCVLTLEGMAAIADEAARDACEEAFYAWGLPTAMRSDNGAPFASIGLAGLTKMSAYWIRLGIQLERSRPSHPEDNGRHERMHRTLKAETTRPARANLLQQQQRFDEWVHEFNHERPHEALGMKCPAEVYTPSKNRLPPTMLPLVYPLHDDTVRVDRWGKIRIAGLGQIHITSALSGYDVGIREELDGRWLVTFVTLDLGLVDRTKCLRAPDLQS